MSLMGFATASVHIRSQHALLLQADGKSVAGGRSLVDGWDSIGFAQH